MNTEQLVCSSENYVRGANSVVKKGLKIGMIFEL